MKASLQTQCLLLHARATYREILHNELYYTHSHPKNFNNHLVMFSFLFFWNIKALHFSDITDNLGISDGYLNRLFYSMLSVSILVASRHLIHRNNFPSQNADNVNMGSKALIFSNNDILADANRVLSEKWK